MTQPCCEAFKGNLDEKVKFATRDTTPVQACLWCLCLQLVHERWCCRRDLFTVQRSLGSMTAARRTPTLHILHLMSVSSVLCVKRNEKYI